MKRVLVFSLLTVITLMIVGLLVGIGILLYVSDDLPDFTNISDYRPFLVTTIYSAEGEIVGELYKERRYLVPMKSIPQHVIYAFLAAEDKAFYEHDGVNITSIIRAFIINTWYGAVKQGGSTITQQVVKALLLTPERTYTRKIKEAILAYRLEKYLSKEEILSVYLNQIYFGEGAYGIESASRTYFAKHVNELSIAQAAILAGLPKAPSMYDPYRNPELIKQRQAYVLGQMLDKNWITKQEYESAMNEELSYQRWDSDKIPVQQACLWYVEHVRQELLKFLTKENLKSKNIALKVDGEDALFTLGLNIYTPLRVKEQIAASQALRKGLEDLSKRRGFQGPVRTLTSAQEIQQFLTESLQQFSVDEFRKGGYVQALVTQVTPQYAQVRFAHYTGTIALQDMYWARKPNINQVLGKNNRPHDVTKVLTKGDIVYVAIKPNVEIVLKPNTTLPLVLQQVPAMEGAILSMAVKTGDVVAMVGGYDFHTSKFNRAIQAKRQPGSAFKAIVYSAAMDNGFTPASVVLDAPVAVLDPTTNRLWRPDNYENNFYGYMLLRKGIALSRNLVTIRIAQTIGIPKIVERANQLGIIGSYPNELGVSLGAVEATLIQMVDAFGAFANLGELVKPRFITTIKDPTGFLLYEFPVDTQQVITPQNAFIMQYLLRGVIEEGTGRRALALNMPVIGKTGTSNDEKDGWFIGAIPQLVTGVYVGYDQAQSLGKYEGGARSALPIFVDYMAKIRSQYPNENFLPPEDIVKVQVDSKTGLLPNKDSTIITIPFIKGTEPTEKTGIGDSNSDAYSDVLKELF